MRRHVRPNPARRVLVRDPSRGFAAMPPEGYEVDVSLPHWWRMLRCQGAYGPDLVYARPEPAVRAPEIAPAPDPEPKTLAPKKAAKKEE